MLLSQIFKVELEKEEFVYGEQILPKVTLINNTQKTVYADDFYLNIGIKWIIIGGERSAIDTFKYVGIDPGQEHVAYPSNAIAPGDSLILFGEEILMFADGYCYEDESIRWSEKNVGICLRLGKPLSGLTFLKEGSYKLKASFRTRKYNIFRTTDKLLESEVRFRVRKATDIERMTFEKIILAIKIFQRYRLERTLLASDSLSHFLKDLRKIASSTYRETIAYLSIFLSRYEDESVRMKVGDEYILSYPNSYLAQFLALTYLHSQNLNEDKLRKTMVESILKYRERNMKRIEKIKKDNLKKELIFD